MRFKFQAGKAAAGLLLALVIGSQVNAQGLGEITLDSSINEPLRAHIQLLDADKLDASQVKVALASPAEFQLAGVERSSLLSQLKFEVEIKRDTGARIVVTSTSEITEPYLNFLLGVSWPSGRTLREYTLLLDLPKRNTTANPPTITRSAPAVQPAGAGNQSDSPQQGAPQHEVKRGETLQQIAEQTRPSNQVGVQQMMIAIQRANEDAFVNNNVNRILVGKVLRIPRMEEIQLIDQDAAIAQINAQNQALASETLAVNNNTGAKPPARDELTLLSGDRDGKAGGSNDLDATIKQLESQLMVSEENLDRARLENLELTNRLSAVQEQIDTLQNIIAIEDDRIAQLQAQLSKQSVATQDALAKVEDSVASGDGEESGLVAMLGNSMVLLGGVLAVALGVAMMMFIRRRNAQAALAEGSDDSLDTMADEVAAEKEPSALRMVLDGLLARFRRKEKNEEEEDVTISDAAVEAIAAEQAPAAPVAKKAAPTTENLLDEMGLTDDFMGLGGALDEVDTARVEPTVEAAPVAAELPLSDDAIAEAGSVMQEAALLDQALNEAGESEPEPAVETAPEAPSVSAAPDSFAFTSEPAVEEPADEVAAETESDSEEKPEVFEFSLPNLEDDSADTAVAAEAKPEGTQEEKHESIAFDTSALALDASTDDTSAPAMPIQDDELEVLSFDENSVKLDDEEEIALDDGAGTMDTHDARLDLAVAYEAMGDLDGAIEILDEVIASGRTTQVAEAQRLKQKWKNG
jgi:pilus assembly protein FimV